MANSTIKKPLEVLTKTLTATTNSGGSIELGMDQYTYTVISVREDNGYKPVPFTFAMQWRVNVYDTTGASMTALPNTECILKVYYIRN